MTREEIIKLAAEAGFKWPDICETTIEQRLERFANLVVAAEREKLTGTQEFVTLQREVVERALASLESEFGRHSKSASDIRAALKQPQNYALDAGNMVPAGWKLVPVEPTRDMLDFAEKFAPKTPRAQYLAMLDAAPQPPAPWCKATKRGDHVVCDDCKSAWDANDKNPPACVPAPPAVDQPQAEQPAMTPIAQRKLDSLLAEGYTISGYSVYHEQKHQHGFVTGAGLVGWWKPEGVEYPKPLGEQEPVAWQGRDGYLYHFIEEPKPGDHPLYTHPQPKCEPLTDEQIGALARNVPSGYHGFAQQALYDFRAFARAIEHHHNIK